MALEFAEDTTGQVWQGMSRRLERGGGALDLQRSDARQQTSQVLGTWCPTILDVEASGFGRGSYPIEIGLARADGTHSALLIRPLDEWIHWDPKAELLHGITRDQLMQEGHSPLEVARWLNDELREVGVAYSDSWGYDSSWVGRLFNDVDLLPGFRLESLRRLLDECQLARWNATKARVEVEAGIHRHRAGEDVRLLQQTYLRSLCH